MRNLFNHVRFFISIAVICFFVGIGLAKEAPATEAAKLLPDQFQSFRATAPVKFGDLNPSVASRSYKSDSGTSFTIDVIHTDRDASAYATLTLLAKNDQKLDVGKIGVASLDSPERILFYQGANLVQFQWSGNQTHEAILNAARLFAATLPAGDDDFPVLVKHLPIGSTSAHPSYAVSLNQLKSVVNGQPILDVLDFEGGSEAVVANYGQSQLVIVEFTTPQFSIDNDSRIWTKIAELKSQGQPIPSAYRRVGNYSVFVFNAPDEKTANALVDQVKYEQVVQWLGDDPHLYERLQRYFTQTSAGVLVAVLKSSGLSLLLCLAAGALIGTMMFRHRRAQRAALYSDAGGSIRLNLDDLTGPPNTNRLLKSGSSSEQTTSKT